MECSRGVRAGGVMLGRLGQPNLRQKLPLGWMRPLGITFTFWAAAPFGFVGEGGLERKRHGRRAAL